MSLEQEIRNRWATSDSLPPLVPASKVFTGRAYGNPEPPYVVLTRQGSQPQTRTSSGTTIYHVRVRLVLHTADLDAGKTIVTQIRQRFDRSHFDLDDGAVLNMQLDKYDEQLPGDGVWRLTSDYIVITEQSN